MTKLTKQQIQERQIACMEKMDELDEKARVENREFTEEEARKYDALVRESAGLSARAKAMATGKELEQMREHKSKDTILREYLKGCVEKRSNASTVLANPVTSGDDQNTYGNLEAAGTIPVTIKDILDTQVPGIELPGSLNFVTGVIGNEIWPVSTNDVKFTVAGEVEQVSEQGLNFDKISAVPNRVAASLAVSHRAIDNNAFDLLSYVTFKMRKGWNILKALHVYSHCAFGNDLKSPFANVTVKEITLDENVGENLALEAAEILDLGFGIPTFSMDKVTETKLSFKKAIPGQTGDRTVVQDGKCVGYPMTITPYVNYTLVDDEPTKESDRYVAIGDYNFLAFQQHGEVRFNVDAQSSANFDRGTVVISMSTDLSETELSSKINGNTSGKPQAFKLIKLVEDSSSDI